ncbi:hypothetical protein KY335_02150 [Candidatus Woesearchaeota archaeon]|nr:hypothetical protein [Candidatus Woesearchaeota archaeon]
MLPRNPARENVHPQWRMYEASFNKDMDYLIHRNHYTLYNMGQDFLNDVFKVRCNGSFSDVTDLILDCEIKEVNCKRDNLQIWLRREISLDELEKFARHYVEALVFFYGLPREKLRVGVLKARGCALIDYEGEIINVFRQKVDGSDQNILVLESLEREVADDYHALMESTIQDKETAKVQ